MVSAGCVTQQRWTPPVDPYGSDRAQFLHRDVNECRSMAFEVSICAPAQGARGALMDGAVGAAPGAALGNAGRGAAIGAAAGGIGTGIARTQQSEAEFAYIGHDGEFAVARVKTKTAAEPGQDEFVGNVTDAIVGFHTENGVRKLCGKHLLGVVVVPE